MYYEPYQAYKLTWVIGLGELLWLLDVYHLLCVMITNCFKWHFHLNYWLDSDQTWKEWTLYGPLHQLIKWFQFVSYLGHMG